MQQEEVPSLGLELPDWLDEFGRDEGYIQALDADTACLPDFKRYNPFPEEYSKVVSHWKTQMNTPD